MRGTLINYLILRTFTIRWPIVFLILLLFASALIACSSESKAPGSSNTVLTDNGAVSILRSHIRGCLDELKRRELDARLPGAEYPERASILRKYNTEKAFLKDELDLRIQAISENRKERDTALYDQQIRTDRQRQRQLYEGIAATRLALVGETLDKETAARAEYAGNQEALRHKYEEKTHQMVLNTLGSESEWEISARYYGEETRYFPEDWGVPSQQIEIWIATGPGLDKIDNRWQRTPGTWEVYPGVPRALPIDGPALDYKTLTKNFC